MEKFEEYKPRLKTLKPKVRQKAVEFANELMDEEGMERDEAMEEGIKRAEIWFQSLFG